MVGDILPCAALRTGCNDVTRHAARKRKRGTVQRYERSFDVVLYRIAHLQIV